MVDGPSERLDGFSRSPRVHERAPERAESLAEVVVQLLSFEPLGFLDRDLGALDRTLRVAVDLAARGVDAERDADASGESEERALVEALEELICGPRLPCVEMEEASVAQGSRAQRRARAGRSGMVGPLHRVAVQTRAR